MLLRTGLRRFTKSTPSQIRDDESAKKAAAVGKVYFNILRLECGESKYPLVCVETKPKPVPVPAEKAEEDNLGKEFLFIKGLQIVQFPPTSPIKAGKIFYSSYISFYILFPLTPSTHYIV
jgi:hypothetical protein